MSAVIWFRKGLRLHDNPALLAAAATAAKTNGGALYPVFVLDPWFLVPERVSANRVQFLLQSLRCLDASLREANSQLIVLRGKPAEVLPAFMASHGVVALAFEADTEPYAVKRDAEIVAMAGSTGVRVTTHCSHTLYDHQHLLAKNGGAVPKTFKAFQTVLAKAGAPAAPLAAPAALPPPTGLVPADSGVPSLAELGYDPADATTTIAGGEKEAFRRMGLFFADRRRTALFEKPSTDPQAWDPGKASSSTTVLSPFLKFGCLSPRRFRADLLEACAEYAATKGAKPMPAMAQTTLEGQLLWREFWYLTACNTPGHFDSMVANPICRQIDWDSNPELLAAWRAGETGFPWIDAVMAQLRQEGWIHHLARHAVACFLTRGDLYQSWEAGAKVFDHQLLDADWSLNTCNWLWLSASAFYHTYFRCYSPVAFPKKYDKKGAYVRKYLPVLAKLPDKYIYEPWAAPAAVLKAAGVVLGENYPHPLVDHPTISKANMTRIGACFKKKEYGSPAAGPAGAHPLPAGLRQVGCAHEGAAKGSGGGGQPKKVRAAGGDAKPAKRAKTMDDFVIRKKPPPAA